MRSGFLVSKNPIKFRSWPGLWNFTELLIRFPVLTFLTSPLLYQRSSDLQDFPTKYAGVVMMEMVVTDDDEDDVI